MSDEELNDGDETTEINLARSSWIDSEFYKHNYCPHCGSDDVVPAPDEERPEAEPTHWKCSSCGELIP